VWREQNTEINELLLENVSNIIGDNKQVGKKYIAKLRRQSQAGRLLERSTSTRNRL